MGKIKFFGKDESVIAARGMDWGLVIELHTLTGDIDIHQTGFSLKSTRLILATCLAATDERLRLVDGNDSH